jgi:hypothetical protein
LLLLFACVCLLGVSIVLDAGGLALPWIVR